MRFGALLAALAAVGAVSAENKPNKPGKPGKGKPNIVLIRESAHPAQQCWITGD